MVIYNCKTCGKECHNKYNKVLTYCSSKCSNRDPEVIARMVSSQKKTYQIKYGGHPMSLEDVRKKQQSTMQEKYGVKHALTKDEFKCRVKETKEEKYGSSSYNNQEKIKATKLSKYGTPTYNGQKKRTETAINKKIFEWEDIRILDYDFNTPIINQIFTIQCTKCESTWTGKLVNNYKPSCRFCSDKYSYVKISKGHQEIVDYIKSILPPTVSVLVNDRLLLNGDEVDIYIPEYKIAFEFNGIFFHSNLFKEKSYHIKKTRRCLSRGITLIHVFDYQWWNNKELIKSMIAAKLGIFKQRLFARKCQIREVKPTIKKAFLLQNHLSGTANSSVNLGLYYEEELISIVTFSKPRFDTKADWEIIRFANKQNTQIIGGFSKLLKHFIKHYNPSLIITYCDRTWSSGETYFKAGFSFHDFTPPNYFYFKNLSVFARQIFQKHKLEKLLSIFDVQKTEFENMAENGYLRFWDCGNIKLYYNPVNIKKP